MPNWCINQLRVTSKNNNFDRSKFWKAVAPLDAVDTDSLSDADKIIDVLTPKVETGICSFERLLPTPDGDGWYEWRINNWGTKWDIDDDEVNVVSDDDNEIILVFTTAWSPPVGWFAALGEALPDAEVSLVYAEQGMCFAGHTIFKNGAVQDEQAAHGEEKEFLEILGCGDFWWEEEEDE